MLPPIAVRLWCDQVGDAITVRMKTRLGLAVAATAGVVAVQCAPEPSRPPLSTPAASVTATAPAPRAALPAAVTPVTAAELGESWRPGCPVAPQDLRRVHVDYVGLDGLTHRGDLVVHRDLATEVIEIFGQLQRLRYPVARMRTVEHYPSAQDELSMQDNNTSAFNCRRLPGSVKWSPHAYGKAIDLNPLVNPYLDATGDLQPKTAGQYLNRDRTDPGLLRAGDPAVLAFTDRGWSWGGGWHNPIDYQHFERP